MSYNIGPKIGIEGEAEFRKQIGKINTEYKTLEAQTKAVAAQYDAVGDEQGKLKAVSEQLERQIDSQKEKMALLEDAVSKASEKFGDNSTEATRLKGVLYDTEATVAGLESELRNTQRQLDEMGDEMGDVEHATEDAEEALLDFGDVLNANLAADFAKDALQEVCDLVMEFAEGMPEAAAEVKAAESQFEQTFGDMQDRAEDALGAISDETKIATTRMQGDFTKLYAFTKTAGADSETALDIATRAMSAAADSAAYYDKSIEDVTESLQSFLKGNYENDSALGISATETTRNTKANEKYAKSFKELSESQKIDVLLSMVEAGNEASGALGQAAREADSWANVTGELDEAMKQLQARLGDPVLKGATPIIQEITAAVYELTEEPSWAKLKSGIDDFNDSLENAQAQFDATQAKTESNVYIAEQYVQRLKDLEVAGLNTDEAHREYAATVAALNDLIPDLNLTIDEQTGLINQNTDAILADIDAWKDRAIQQAMQDKLNTEIEAQAAVTADLYDAEAKLIKLEAEEADIRRRLEDVTDDAGKETSGFSKLLIANAKAYSNSTDAAAGLAVAQSELASTDSRLFTEYERIEQELNENLIAQANLKDTISLGKETIAEYEGGIRTASEAMGLYETQTEDATEAQLAQEERIRSAQEALDELETSYAEAKEAARDSIDSQIGLFDELATESEKSAEEIIDNWYAQKKAFDNYAANLKKAVNMGLDDALVQQLADGSEESMLILDEFVNGTEADVSEINEAFRGMDQSRQYVSEAMVGIQTEYEKTMAEIIASAKEDGIYIVDGVAGAVEKNAYRFERAMQQMGKKGIVAFNQTLEINSPSRVMERSAGYTVDGAVITIEARTEDFERAMANLASAGERAFLAQRLEAAEWYPTYVELPGTAAASTAPAQKNYGGFEFHIYQQPGEDAEDFAYRVMDIMQAEVTRREASLGG